MNQAILWRRILEENEGGERPLVQFNFKLDSERRRQREELKIRVRTARFRKVRTSRLQLYAITTRLQLVQWIVSVMQFHLLRLFLLFSLLCRCLKKASSNIGITAWGKHEGAGPYISARTKRRICSKTWGRVGSHNRKQQVKTLLDDLFCFFLFVSLALVGDFATGKMSMYPPCCGYLPAPLFLKSDFLTRKRFSGYIAYCRQLVSYHIICSTLLTNI